MLVILGLLALNFGAAAYLVLMFRSGLVSERHRRWPPARLSTQSLLEIWGLSSVVFLSVYALGAVDAGRFDWPATLRLWVGLPLCVLGSFAISVGMFQLGMARTSGADHGICDTGLYRVLRHPQYTGHAFAITGWVLYTASLWSIPAVCAAYVALYYAVRAEDSWLSLRHGTAHREYIQRVRSVI